MNYFIRFCLKCLDRSRRIDGHFYPSAPEVPGICQSQASVSGKRFASVLSMGVLRLTGCGKTTLQVVLCLFRQK